jgi:Glycosyltransferase family 92
MALLRSESARLSSRAMTDRKVLRPDLESGYFEELDQDSTPWKGLGRFRFQAQGRRRIDKRVLSREDVDALMAASNETPQRVGIEGDPRHWWAFDGYWYVTRADLAAADVVELVQEHYREELADWGVTPSPEPPPSAARETDTYLAVCSMFLNGEAYLAEWLEFHLLAGVERFYLYDHESTDGSRELLAPYVEDGTVVVYDWPVYPGQREAFQDCVERHRHDSRWIAFFDLDEFLYSGTGRPVPDILRAFEPWPGVLVNRPAFGSAGRDAMPSGLVTENYPLRSNISRRNRAGKTIADPMRVSECGGGHHWSYTEGYAVDERLRPAPISRTLSVSFSLLRVNHYAVRSRQEFEEKLATPRADTGSLREGRTTFESINQGLNDVTDLSASALAPALKDALRRKEATPG